MNTRASFQVFCSRCTRNLLAVWALISIGIILNVGSAVAEPLPLKRIAHLGGRWTSLAASERHLFIATGSSITVLDVSDYGRPRITATSESAGKPIETLAVQGTHLYVGVGVAGLRIFNSEGVGAPAMIGSLPTRASAQSLLVMDHTLYVAGGAEIEALDLADPSHPTSLWHLDTLPKSGHVNAIRASGAYVYVASDEGLTIIDVGDPMGPRIANSISDFGVRSMVLVGEYAYVLAMTRMGDPTGNGTELKNSLKIFHVEVPEDITLNLELDLDERPDDIIALNNGVFVVFPSELRAYPTVDPLHVRETARTPLTWTASWTSGPGRAAVVGQHIWVTVNGAAESSGTPASHYGTKAGVIAVAASSSSVYQISELLDENWSDIDKMRSAGRKLMLIDRDSESAAVADISDAGMPQKVDRMVANDLILDGDVSGDRVAILDGETVRIVETTGTGKFDNIASTRIAGAYSLTMSGDVVGVIIRRENEGSTDLVTLHVNGGSLEELGRAALSVSPGCTADMDSRRLVAVCGKFAMKSVRVPADFGPVVEASESLLPFSGMGVTIQGDKAYVAARWPTPDGEPVEYPPATYGGLQVVDLRMAGKLKLEGDFRAKLEGAGAASGVGVGIAMLRDMAVLGLREQRIRVLDVTNGLGPRSVQTESLAGDVWAVASSGDFLFAAGRTDGIDIFQRAEVPTATPAPSPVPDARRILLPIVVTRR